SVFSELAVTAQRPFAEKATLHTVSFLPPTPATSLPDSMSQTRMARSPPWYWLPPDRTRRPSGAKATRMTARSCPSKRRISLPVSLAGFDAPEAHGIVITAGEGAAAVGRKCHAVDFPGMALKTAQLLAGLQVPQAHRAVVARRQGAAAIG